METEMSTPVTLSMAKNMDKVNLSNEMVQSMMASGLKTKNLKELRHILTEIFTTENFLLTKGMEKENLQKLMEHTKREHSIMATSG